MNAQQRKQIQQAIDTLTPFTDADHCIENLRTFNAVVEAAKSVFEEESEAEQEKFDNMPEGLQSSEKGERLETAAEALSSAATDLGDIDGSEDDVGKLPDDEQGYWAEAAAEAIQSAIDQAEEAITA